MISFILNARILIYKKRERNTAGNKTKWEMKREVMIIKGLSMFKQLKLSYWVDDQK